jgi:hypothetical protein
MATLFKEFLGKELNPPYRDGEQYKIARGKLKEINDGFLKIEGSLGTIIINQKNVEKMALLHSSVR